MARVHSGHVKAGFLILVDQQELAAQYTNTLVGILVKEVSDQPLPGIPWLQ
jgi:hypothetical protein